MTCKTLGINVSFDILSSNKKYISSNYNTKLIDYNPKKLSTIMSKVENLLSSNKVIDMYINHYPYGYNAIQLILQNGLLISYIIEPDNTLKKIYIDDSIHKYCTNYITHSIIGMNYIYNSLDDGHIIAIVNSQRNKVKRIYIEENKSIIRHFNFNGDNNISIMKLSLDERYLLISNNKFITLYSIKHQCNELPLVYTSTDKHSYTLKQDISFVIIPEIEYQLQSANIRDIHFLTKKIKNTAQDISLSKENNKDDDDNNKANIKEFDPSIIKDNIQNQFIIIKQVDHAKNVHQILHISRYNIQSNNLYEIKSSIFQYIKSKEFAHIKTLIRMNCMIYNHNETKMIIALSTNEILLLDITSIQIKLIKKIYNNNIQHDYPIRLIYHPNHSFFLIFYKSGLILMYDMSLQLLPFNHLTNTLNVTYINDKTS